MRSPIVDGADKGRSATRAIAKRLKNRGQMSASPAAQLRSLEKLQKAARDQEQAFATSNEALRRAVGGSQPAWMNGTASTTPHLNQQNMLTGSARQSDSPPKAKKHARSASRSSLGFATAEQSKSATSQSPVTPHVAMEGDLSKRQRVSVSINQANSPILVASTANVVNNDHSAPDAPLSLATPTINQHSIWDGSPMPTVPVATIASSTPVTDILTNAPPVPSHTRHSSMTRPNSTSGTRSLTHGPPTPLLGSNLSSPMLHSNLQSPIMANPSMVAPRRVISSGASTANLVPTRTAQQSQAPSMPLIASAPARAHPSRSHPILRDINLSSVARWITNDEYLTLNCFAHDPDSQTMPYSDSHLQHKFAELNFCVRQLFIPEIQVKNCVFGRLTALQQAMHCKDQLFLVLHQLMSQHADTNTWWPPEMNNVKAISFFQHLLGGNVKLPAPIISAFTDFPLPLASMIQNYKTFTVFWMTQINLMFNHLSLKIDKLTEDCMKRHYPPTVKEMLLRLAVPSVQIMECIVIYTCKKIWSMDDKHTIQANEQGLSVYHRNLAAVSYPRPNVQAILDLDETPFRQAYLKIDNDLRMVLETRRQHVLLQQNARAQAAQNGQLQQVNHQNRQNSWPTPGTIERPLGQNTTGSQANSNAQNMPPRGMMYRTPQVGIPQFGPPQFGTPSMPLQGFALVPSPTTLGSTLAVQRPENRTIPNDQARQNSLSISNTGGAVQSMNLFYASTNEKASQPRVPMPERSAIHQAHLAEPILRVLLDDQPTKLQYFQYLQDAPEGPYELSTSKVKQNIPLVVSEESIRQIPPLQFVMGKGLKLRDLGPDSVQYRLKCFHKNKKLKTEFPQWLYLTLNGQGLEVRKKLHYGTDLPIDITDMVQAGHNDLTVLLRLKTGDEKIAGWTLIVEVVRLATEASIRSLVVKATLSEHDVLAKMISHLSADDVGEDDDGFMMVSQSLRIKVADPITRGLIGEMPVRAKDCKHFDCFALGSFLESRPLCKKKLAPNRFFDHVEATISEADKWACPMYGCDADARPANLRLDLWMKKIQSMLVGRENGNDYVVVVEKDGSWKIEPPKKKT